MVTYALTAFTVVALLLLLLGRNRSGATRSGHRALPVRHTGPYAAVSLEPAPIACDAAQRFAGRRYLRDEAPGVPLRDCDGRRCGCRLVTHPDRRQLGTDRRLGVGLQSELYLTSGNHDRRQAPRGRRSSDLAAV
ncbi:MAG TPA: hypothetical protein DD491_05655 [Halieaceae bacterium]|nr:hypothetical protein [Halieaceae bacterium]